MKLFYGDDDHVVDDDDDDDDGLLISVPNVGTEQQRVFSPPSERERAISLSWAGRVCTDTDREGHRKKSVAGNFHK